MIECLFMCIKFLQSEEFKHLLEFFDQQYPKLKEQAKEFIQKIELRKDILNFKKSLEFAEH